MSGGLQRARRARSFQARSSASALHRQVAIRNEAPFADMSSRGAEFLYVSLGAACIR
jgi:hypothetical protein